MLTGRLGALFGDDVVTAEAGTGAVIDVLNRAYDVPEWRPWWKRRLPAMLLTVALALFIIIALALVLVGSTMVLQAPLRRAQGRESPATH